ncbi:hypothetical protein PA7_46380 [Pseudonocardia asaccharolytica DSM 44247 = NBRC 16224]|uniref:Uncharacterized protein n=2 Tax=Pseudonocardia asaccharolytica TaxID=54010 RepID=A0A511D7L8_9PSEU|nr:hypothetical protein PA7_46380 [Pseudonocardia asaccharolytica DSM 44247 = NBRC 16224]
MSAQPGPPLPNKFPQATDLVAAHSAASARFTAVSMVQTVLIYVVTPLVVCLVVALMVMAPRMARRPRYRVGQPWTYEPLFWTANPEGAGLPPAPEEDTVTGEPGGARGSW